MPGNIIANTEPAVRAIVHSELLLKQLEDGFLPDGLIRDVSDFGDGSLIQIPTVGEMPLFDIVEGEDTPLSALDTGKVTLQITKHKGAGGTISDELKEDGYMAASVEAEIVPQGLKAIKEAYETDILKQAVNQADRATGAVINNAAHCFAASGANNTITIKDINYLKFAMDKANVADEGRILIVDPITELTFNNLVGAQAFTNNPMFEGMVGEGFSKNRKFIRNIAGFDIWVSNRLHKEATFTANQTVGTLPPVGASSSVTNAVLNVAMSVASDMDKPFMGAWRRMPRVEGDRNVSLRQDEFHITARWGNGIQREATLAVLATSSESFE